MAFLYVPNGMHMEAWTPAEVGPLGSLPPTLEPLAAVKDELLVLTGLAQETARPTATAPATTPARSPRS